MGNDYPGAIDLLSSGRVNVRAIVSHARARPQPGDPRTESVWRAGAKSANLEKEN
jgi:hypothetical protein